MLFSAATSPGSSQPNEDWAAVSPTIGVILDGVTVFDQSQTGCHHGTPWYVSKLGTHLFATASDPAVTLADALARAIKDVAALHADTCDLEKIGAPSAAVGAVRLGEDSVDYLVLADVTILLETVEGLSVISDDRVVDTVSDLEGQENIGAQVMERRARYRNQSGGYWVAAADPSIAEHTITGHIRHAGLRNAVLMTDGAARLVTPFAQTDWRGLLALAVGSSVASAIERVRSLEASDPDGKRWPRFKRSDDATIAVIGTS